jgi:UDP-N-acetylglucosamine 4,6-dehydratase
VRSLLITGGTGTFGRAFARYAINHFDRVCIYSRGEHAQADMAAAFNHDGRLRWFVGDVRDRDRLRRAMQGVDVVVHAAALKRIEVGHYNPTEMVRTNVDGAINVTEAARDAGVSVVVALSTDKACYPVSPYGYSKALSESIFLAANDQRGPRFAVTRYGNVAGSTGSVIPTWRAILKTTDTVPVTDPDCTRFWMTIDEAVALVADTIHTCKGGELRIPDLPAYRLADLAAAMSAKTWETGLGKWEKRDEEMQPGQSSRNARRMTVDDLREALASV